MKAKKIVDETTNRGEFNRAYKFYLEHKSGGINCSRCPYHRGENRTKYYGGFIHKSVTYPNWKMVSKNRKQWMKKPLKKETRDLNRGRYDDEMIFVSFKW